MTSLKLDIDDVVSPAHPNVRRIDPADLRDALAKGLDDFMAMPTFSLFLVAVYPIIGLILFWLTFGLDMMQLVFPLIAGFALIGPLAAIGLYELSRRREQGLGVSLGGLEGYPFPVHPRHNCARHRADGDLFRLAGCSNGRLSPELR